MFCLKCCEAIPDDSITCPNCGADIKVNVGEARGEEQAVVYASQKEEVINTNVNEENIPKKNFYIWSIFAIAGLILLSLNYFKISVSLYFSGSSDSSYTGYGLLKCLQGTVGTSGYMVILMIISNVAILITGFLGAKGNIIKNNAIKIIMIIESILYLIASIVPYFNIKQQLAEFDSDLSTTSIGAGCYLNIALAIVMMIFYWVNLHKQLSRNE
ncbi:MAG: hypothetical protein KA953_03160 [Lachnospiraceae bacterium]|nr:hypothetical protein [Lachnospiraceae bacterium]